MCLTQVKLLTTRRYVPLLICQLSNNLSDHILRVILLLFALDQVMRVSMLALGTAAFLIPLLLLSGHAGILADISEKARLLKIIKFFGVLIAGLAVWAVTSNNIWLMLLTVFALGCEVAYFVPCKQSVIAQLLKTEELLFGNALLNIGLFGAALTAIWLYTQYGIYPIALTMLGVAVVGWLSSLFIPHAKALSQDKVSYYLLEQDRIILFCIICIGWFWFVNYIYLTQFSAYVIAMGRVIPDPLRLCSTYVAGVALGSLAISFLLRRKIKLNYLAIALLIHIICATDLFFASHAAAVTMIFIDLFVIGFSFGIYIVPLYATLQHKSEPMFRARNFAFSSIVNVKLIILAFFMLLILKYKHVAVLDALLIAPISAVALLFYVMACNKS